MENTISQELQTMEAQLNAELSGVQLATEPTPEVVSSEGIKEDNQAKDTAEETVSDTHKESNDSSDETSRLAKLEEQRKRMLATKSKDEREKELLRSELESYKERIQKAESIIKDYESWDTERTLENDSLYIDARTDKKLSETQIKALERQDKIAFLRDNDFTTDEFAWIEEIKATYPNMTWDKATKLYLAENKPEYFAPKEAKTSSLSVGTEPKITEKPKSDKDKSLKELEASLMGMDTAF